MKLDRSKPFAGYARISRVGKRDDERLRSPEFQTALITNCAELNGVDLIMFPVEYDVSGSKGQRAILDEIIAGIKAGELGGIVIPKLDRLSRLKPGDRARLFEEIEGAGGVILSASESLDATTAEGRLMREIFLGIARYQWEKADEGFEMAKQAAIKKGAPILADVPFGYRRDERGPDGQLVLDPVEAPIVLELFERRAAGEACSSLAAWLNGLGIKTSLGNRWVRQTVERVFAKRIYLGEASYGTDRRYVNAEAHQPIPGLDLALFTAAQIPRQKPAPARQGDSAWILTGLLRCTSCGYTMRPATSGKYNRRVYVCLGRYAGGLCPHRARISAKAVEPQALETLRDVLRSKIKAKPKRDDGSGRLAKLESELEKIDARHAEHADPDTRALIGNDEVWKAGLRKLNEQRDALMAEVGAARLAMRRDPNGRSPADILNDLEEMSLADLRDMLGLHFDFIAVTPDKRTFAFGPGMGPAGLPRRGQRRSDASLCPIDVPDAAAVAG